jgi:hypothetical protein
MIIYKSFNEVNNLLKQLDGNIINKYKYQIIIYKKYFFCFKNN